MICRWLICFSALAAVAGAQNGRGGPAVTGRVQLTDSQDAAVRKQKNYSGVVVWLEPAGRPAPAASLQHAQMLQKGKKFIPHVLAVPVGATVDFPNRDPIFHNAFSSFAGQPFDIGLYAPGTSKAVTFRHPGIVRVFCNIHSTMSAIIAVIPTPWYAVSDKSGEWRIAGVPPGEYRLQFFHERSLPEKLRGLERRIAVGPQGAEVGPVSISETGYMPAPHVNKHGQPYPPVADERLYPGGK